MTQKCKKRNSIKTYNREEKAKRMMDFRMHKININYVKIILKKKNTRKMGGAIKIFHLLEDFKQTMNSIVSSNLRVATTVELNLYVQQIHLSIFDILAAFVLHRYHQVCRVSQVAQW